MKKSTKGALVAVAVAGLFAANTAIAGEGEAAAEAKVKCQGINACKGQAACTTADHACAGMNECKGKGWIMVTKKECEEKGGTVLE